MVYRLKHSINRKRRWNKFKFSNSIIQLYKNALFNKTLRIYIKGYRFLSFAKTFKKSSQNNFKKAGTETEIPKERQIFSERIHVIDELRLV